MNVVERVLAVIDEAIDAGADHMAACAQGLEWVKREGLSEELLAEEGLRLLSDLHRNQRAAIQPAAEWTTPGRSRVEAGAVNRAADAFRNYEAVVNKRIGQCGIDDLRALAEHRDMLSTANAHSASGFRTMIRRLQARRAKTVLEAYKDDLAAFLKIYRGARDAA